VMDLAPFPYHRAISENERARYEEEGRAAADDHPNAGLVFTDGLGVLGVGSYDDGPASIRQAAYDAAIRDNAP
jgi:hypothetical protein